MRRKTSGNTCARPISPTACSKTTPQSSTLASSHGVAFSTSSVASSPSPAVIGLLPVNHSEVWYKATVLRAVTEDYLRRSGLDIKLDHGVDNMAMAMSLVASTRGLALMPAYAKNLLPRSVVSRPLKGEAPTIDIAVGYSKANTSPILKLFLSRLEELRPEKKS